MNMAVSIPLNLRHWISVHFFYFFRRKSLDVKQQRGSEMRGNKKNHFFGLSWGVGASKPVTHHCYHLVCDVREVQIEGV